MSNKRSCIIPNCFKEGIYKFPIDDSIKSKWIEASTLDKFRKRLLRKHSKICSNHFKPSDFKILLSGKRKLKPGAVPSRFPWIETSLQTSLENKENDDINRHLNIIKPQTTYARKHLPIQFAEEILTMEEPNLLETDPLLLSQCDELIEYSFEDSPCENNNEVQVEDQVAENYMSQDNLDITEKKDNSVQCDPIQELNLTDDEKCPYSVHNYKHNDRAIHFFTGLETFEKLMFVYSTLEINSSLKYFYGDPPRKLDNLEQFLITLLILRRHREFEDIAMSYLITKIQVSNIFITWIRLMALQWKNLDLWVDRDTIQTYMPLDFFDKFPMTRVILDASESPIQKPGLPSAQQITFSSYKNRNTVKYLIGIAPSGLITYVSPTYGGSATDRQILERSDILSRFTPNDEIMVDKGLDIQDIVMPYGAKVNMPTFFKKGNQINPDTLLKDRKIASKRVHVERIIGMLKTYKILVQPMNHTETLLSGDIVFICAMLVNFKSNIIDIYA